MSIQEYQIVGPPGTGKTTTIARQVRADVERYGGDGVLLCSLTRTAAAELAGRDLPVPREHVGTLHAHGYRALGRPELAEAHLAEWNQAEPSLALSGGAPDTDEPETEHRFETRGDELFAAYHLLRAQRRPRTLWPGPVLALAARWETWKRASGRVDFTDMIELPLTEGLGLPGAPAVIVADEAQDLSRLEISLLRMWGERAERLYVVGDRDQALYDWRGSDPEVLAAANVPPDRRKVLGHSHRVPAAVHALATRWIAQITGRDPAPYAPRRVAGCECAGCSLPDVAGEVVRNGASLREPERFVQLIERELSDGRTVMLLTTCGYMLAPVIRALREAGVPYHNPYRRRRGDWNPLRAARGVTWAERLLSFTRPNSALHGDAADYWTPQDLKRWAEHTRAEVFVRGGKAAIARLDGTEPLLFGDLAAFIRPEALAEAFYGRPEWLAQHTIASKQKSLQFPVRVLERHGVAGLSEEPRVVVGTMHSVKGGEADTVVLFPDLSHAGMAEWQQPGPGREGIVRQFYVGMTRARQRLVLCAPAGPLTVSV